MVPARPVFQAAGGVYPCFGPTVELGGNPWPPAPAAGGAAQRGLVVVPQSRMIFPPLTVHENRTTTFAPLPQSDHRNPDEDCALFPVLKNMTSRCGAGFSGGQQQQLAIGRTMILRPKVVLLDKPIEGIQPNIIQLFGRVIWFLKGQGDMAIVPVEQCFAHGYGLPDQFQVAPRGAVLTFETKAEVSV